MMMKTNKEQNVVDLTMTEHFQKKEFSGDVNDANGKRIAIEFFSNTHSLPTITKL